jgi:HEPN domain-containing protein
MLREAGRGDPERAWLLRHSPGDWIRQGLSELARAESALKSHDRVAGVLGLRRAAGMALNGALCVTFREWGRTYVDHLRAVAEDSSVPDAVREAARVLNRVELERTPNVVRLTPPSESLRWVEAAKTLMAHAYAVVHGSVGQKP